VGWWAAKIWVRSNVSEWVLGLLKSERGPVWHRCTEDPSDRPAQTAGPSHHHCGLV
jgi:hypothetical protein